MLHRFFRVNLHAELVKTSTNSLLGRTKFPKTWIDWNGARTYNLTIPKRILNKLAKPAKLLNNTVTTYLCGVINSIWLACCIHLLEKIFTLKYKFSQLSQVDRFSQGYSIIQPNELTGPVFIYELRFCGFWVPFQLKSRHLKVNIRSNTCTRNYNAHM